MSNYPNGRVPRYALRKVPASGHSTVLVTRKTKNALVALERDALKHDIHITVLAGGGYRSLTAQEVLWVNNDHGGEHYVIVAGHKIMLSPPGASSHGTGSRVDFIANGSHEKLVELARAHGFIQDIRGDINHFHHV